MRMHLLKAYLELTGAKDCWLSPHCIELDNSHAPHLSTNDARKHARERRAHARGLVPGPGPPPRRRRRCRALRRRRACAVVRPEVTLRPVRPLARTLATCDNATGDNDTHCVSPLGLAAPFCAKGILRLADKGFYSSGEQQHCVLSIKSQTSCQRPSETCSQLQLSVEVGFTQCSHGQSSSIHL
jgi:hypothetical protein